MIFNTLIIELKSRGYSPNPWIRGNKIRIYFNLRKKIDSFIDFKLDTDGTIISYSPQTYYAGKPVDSRKWVDNFLKPTNDDLQDIIQVIDTILTNSL